MDTSLTATQKRAHKALTARGTLWWSSGRGQPHMFSRATLQALVDAGLAQWVHTEDIKPPHIIPTSKEA